MEFPDTLLINKHLLKNNPAYESKKTTVARLKAYYDGSEDFPIAAELRKKPVEMSGDECAQNVRSAREGAAYYTNYFGDTIADQVSSICKYPILIDCDTSPDAYWSSVQFNADGQFGSLTEQARAALTDDFVYDNAFYLVRFPNKARGNFDEQLKGGALDARYLHLDSVIVTDWKPLPAGGLEWARTYEIIPTRDVGAIGPYSKNTHRWTFYDKDAIAVYEITVDAQVTFDDAATATRVGEPATHALKVCPVFKVNRKLRCAVGRKLLPTAKQLFNEESDGSYYQFVTITGGLFVSTDQPSKFESGMTLTPFGAVILGPNDKIDRDKADPATLDALAKAAAARRGQMGGMIHAMARQTATQSASGQNTSRASGAGMEQQAEPIESWGLGFSAPHIATIRQMLEAVAAIREQDITDLMVSGLCSTEQEEAADPIQLGPMQAEQIFAQLPHVPQAAKDARGRALGLEANPDADQETVDAIKSEEIKPPAAPTPAGSPEPDDGFVVPKEQAHIFSGKAA